MPTPPLRQQTTTLWDFPSRQYGNEQQGDSNYTGSTPAYIIWNLVNMYTEEQALVVDPMAGSGTTLDVARDCNRKALGYDLNIVRDDVFRADARSLPLEDGKADFVFIDPPYSTHVDYSDDPRCIGKLPASGEEYYQSMSLVIGEINRILRPNRYMGLYVSDSFKKGKPFMPIGFRLFDILSHYFEPVDIIAVRRYNADLSKGNYHKAAEENNYFLRGFNYLFIMHKKKAAPIKKRPQRPKSNKRRSGNKKYGKGGHWSR